MKSLCLVFVLLFTFPAITNSKSYELDFLKSFLEAIVEYNDNYIMYKYYNSFLERIVYFDPETVEEKVEYLGGNITGSFDTILVESLFRVEQVELFDSIGNNNINLIVKDKTFQLGIEIKSSKSPTFSLKTTDGVVTDSEKQIINLQVEYFCLIEDDLILTVLTSDSKYRLIFYYPIKDGNSEKRKLIVREIG